MSKFECKSCGLCCKDSSLNDDKSSYPRFSPNSIIFNLNKPTISMFEWEARKLFKLAKENKINVKIVPYKLVYDKKTRTSLILQYTLAEHKDCPFLIDNKCSIYNDRPLICKFFPANLGSVSDLMKGVNNIKVSVCPNDFTFEQWSEFLSEKVKTKELVEKLEQRYGESYLALLERDLIMKEITDWVKHLVNTKLIDPATEKDNLVNDIINSKKVSLIEYLIRHTGLNVLSFLYESGSLLHAKTFIENIKKSGAGEI
ncbi:YkgJ family cysteine cluster protein [Candidatus Woesearchaeota archaeon]|nr:MAG: YkgJ family cysteine cluster protein [Candidatus Woesearchaeota archaeon]